MSDLGDYFWRKPGPPITSEERDLIRAFHEMFYGRWKRGGGTLDISWLGWRVVKTPMDLWVYQEIISELRPSLIIETGTRFGGSAAFFASMLDLIGSGRVVTIDVDHIADWPQHPRIEYITGMSCSDETVAAVKSNIQPDDRIMVVLDSDHSYDNVLNELRLYSPLVSEGQYLICEDTNLNGHPVRADFGPGPSEAVAEFLKETADFKVDGTRERFLVTVSPGGFLRRIQAKLLDQPEQAKPLSSEL